MGKQERLDDYRTKRNLRRSGEPVGKATAASEGKPRFVVQRHDASTLHFDLRLEINGVLVSWSVPKGPSTDPSKKRLAVRTEDHPMEYAEFKGKIGEGEYGAGTVVVWDTGTFRNLSEHDGDSTDLAEALDRGHLAVWLEGEKLSGGYALTRTKLHGDDEWLLVKMKDEGADRRRKPAKTQPESVLSGRTNEDLDGDD